MTKQQVIKLRQTLKKWRQALKAHEKRAWEDLSFFQGKDRYNALMSADTNHYVIVNLRDALRQASRDLTTVHLSKRSHQ